MKRSLSRFRRSRSSCCRAGPGLVGRPLLGLRAETLTAVTIKVHAGDGALLVIADEFELDVPLAAACITVSTVALFFTMPVMMKMLF
jgi:hypothetical protein